jgi:hypothetical protein
MTNIDFPDNPIVGDEHSAGGKLWRWTGTTWDGVDEFIGLEVGQTGDEPPPGVLFVGAEAPDVGTFGEGDLWSDLDDYSAETEFIFSGPEEPENYGENTLWIDTDAPELPLIYADNEPPEYTNIEGDYWVDLDDTFGTQFVQSNTEPNPGDAEFWVDLTSEEGGASYQDLFKDNASQVLTLEELPLASEYSGMISYVAEDKSLYVASDGSWNKIYPRYDAEVLAWMGI